MVIMQTSQIPLLLEKVLSKVLWQQSIRHKITQNGDKKRVNETV